MYSYLLIAAAVVGMVACTPAHDKTVANLKAAINGESTASAKYAAYAEQAAKDSLFAIEALFKATSQAEAIHVQNHQAVLVTLGVTDYEPIVEQFEVKSTAQNLQTAIDGETYEFTTMYPQFIKDAETEAVQNAIVSFNYAQDSEKGHAKIYADELTKITTPNTLVNIFYVCPKCGNTYAGTPSELCELCQTSANSFIIMEGVASVAPVDNSTGVTPTTKS